MGVNLENINLGLSCVADITEKFKSISHFENVPLQYIKTASNNPYKENDTEETIRELADSINANGLIHPICLNQISPTEYIIISGERRFTAITKHLDWETVPSNVFDNLSANEAELKLHLANLDAREYSSAQKLKFYEAVEKLIQNMIDTGEYSGSKQQAISQVLNVSTRQVRKYKIICEKLDDSQKEQIYKGEMTITDAAKSATQPKAELSSSSEDVTDVEPELSSAFNINKTITKVIKKLEVLYDCELFDYCDKEEISTAIKAVENLANKYNLR